jgi:hypothetical protein
MNHDASTLRLAAPAAGKSRRRRLATLVLAALAATATLTACPEQKGPGEKAGEALDDAGDSLKDAVTPDGPAEDLGEKLDDATR